MPFTPDYPVKPERQAYTEYARIGDGHTGILMLHGYMGSPLSSREMAQGEALRDLRRCEDCNPRIGRSRENGPACH